MKVVKIFLIALFTLISGYLNAQSSVYGNIKDTEDVIPFANVYILENNKGTVSDESGYFLIENLSTGNYTLIVSSIGYKTFTKKFILNNTEAKLINISLIPVAENLDEVVVTGTLKPVSRMESPVPVEVYKPTFFKKNPTPNIFEALQNVNGVRPQINCNVCNTGDIHINGLEGPYTLVLIDGMPIVSGLSTVYGLSGIPNSLVNQIEIVKGPTSSLYGSEAVGGLINIITKHPDNAPAFFADAYGTTWEEYNLDLGFKASLGKKISFLAGVNYYNYNNPVDNNNDNFTDVTLQERISIFQKTNFNRKKNRILSVASRFFYEDRWGGEMQWNKNYRGGDEIYGESIYTKRWELLGQYQLPVSEKMLFSFSYTDHDQNSVYGDVPYLARQRIGFGQLTWDKPVNTHDLLFGVAARYQFYNDNTPATTTSDEVVIPGVFAQDEISLSDKHKLLLGARYDYDKRHGNIFTPRIAYKWSITENDILRLNAGTGFRVVNLFTEEHAALTGSREVVIEEELEPERSYNINLNYLKKIYTDNGTFIGLDASAWYTYFTNSILPDYDTNPNQIIYDNLHGHATTTGISANLDIVFPNGLKLLTGASFMDVSNTENGIKIRQILTERFSATWAVTYTLEQTGLELDYTGNLYGPMRLPLLGQLNPRKEYSPTWSIQNIQLTYKKPKNIELYGGIKNLLNWTPNKGNPFIIARAHDPFDKNVEYDTDGNVIATENNPYALTFDPSYVFAPNQGIRGFIGIRYTLK
ncbi:TonB-dependent receptor [Abyssalbus ytuae]|uniref:TonB-dependent receptor n=1 Tax=Abyssalbus ytuae TaxID=2926907 RepID=A0A9E6ZI74_9FLAO|nr:TonB-dependent receptor [Abyssalbus ytuae]UOB15974.1 TonB-dependent receptor [Abyssalbus ytuae]